MQYVALLGIESDKVTCVLCGDDGKTINAYYRASFGYLGYKAGDYIEYTLPDKKTLMVAVRNCIEKVNLNANLKIKDVVVAVPAPFTQNQSNVYSLGSPSAKPFTVRKSDYNSLADQAIEREPKSSEYQYYLVSKKRCWIDDRLQEGFTENVRANMIKVSFASSYVRTSFCDLIEDVVESLGLRVVTYVGMPLAESAFLIPDEYSESRMFLVNVGHTHTDVTFLYNGDILSTHTLPLGIKSFITDVAGTFKVSTSVAQSLVRMISLDCEYDEETVQVCQTNSNIVLLLYDMIQYALILSVRKLEKGIKGLLKEYNTQIAQYVDRYDLVTDVADVGSQKLPAVFITGSNIASIDGFIDFLDEDMGMTIYGLEHNDKKSNIDSIVAVAAFAIYSGLVTSGSYTGSKKQWFGIFK